MKSASRARVEDLWYGSSPADVAVRTALLPLSGLFAAGATLRGLLYDRGLLATSRAPAPVVSVGALTAGGAGKTPFVLWLAAKLKARGLRPCLVTRGYGRDRSAGGPFVVTSREIGETSLGAAVARAGDEAVLLALRSRLPVAVGGRRAEACDFAMRHLAARGETPDLFLLDDGFQHRALARDLDIVLVSGEEPSLHLLPAGPLREGPHALARADVVVRMRGPTRAREDLGGFCSAPPVDAEVRPSALVAAVDDEAGEPVSALAGARVVAVAGIARPGRFLADLEAAGAKTVARIVRGDHHRFDDDDVRQIRAAARDADLVVTTEKDLVKLAGRCGDAPLRALRVEVRVADEGRLEARAAALAPFDR